MENAQVYSIRKLKLKTYSVERRHLRAEVLQDKLDSGKKEFYKSQFYLRRLHVNF